VRHPAFISIFSSRYVTLKSHVVRFLSKQLLVFRCDLVGVLYNQSYEVYLEQWLSLGRFFCQGLVSTHKLIITSGGKVGNLLL
jgi:hypothetical protein